MLLVDCIFTFLSNVVPAWPNFIRLPFPWQKPSLSSTLASKSQEHLFKDHNWGANGQAPFYLLCRESEKAKRKLHSKVAKRAKLDPDTAQTALDVQHNGVLRVGEAEAEAGEQGEEMIADSAATAKTGQSITEAPQQQRKALLLNGSGKLLKGQQRKAWSCALIECQD